MINANSRFIIISYLFISLIFLSIVSVFVLLNLSLEVDDAFISFRFAKNLSEGYGFRFNAGGETVEGFSNFLWVVFLSLNIFCGFDVVAASVIWGIIFSLLSIFILLKISYFLLEGERFYWLPALFLSLNPSFLFYTLSGMETVFYVFLILVSFYFFLKEEKEEKYKIFYTSNIFFLLASFTRPEGVIFFIASIIYKLCNKNLFQKEYRKDLIKRTMQFTVVFIIYLLWKWFYFGDIFPNSYYVKVTDLSISFKDRILGGIIYIIVFLKENPFFFYLMVLSFLFSLKDKKYIFLFIGIQFFFVVYVGGDSHHFKQWRFLVPIIPFFALLLGLLIKTFSGYCKVKSISYILTGVSLLLYITAIDYSLLNISHFRNRWRFFTTHPLEITTAIKNDLFYVNNLDKSIGEWLSNTYPKHTLLASVQAGQIPFYSGLKFIDLMGLTTREIALKRGDKNKYFELVKEIYPDIVILFEGEIVIYKKLLVEKNYKLKKFFIWENFLKDYCAMALFEKSEDEIEEKISDYFVFGHNKYFLKKEDVIVFKEEHKPYEKKYNN